MNAFRFSDDEDHPDLRIQASAATRLHLVKRGDEPASNDAPVTTKPKEVIVTDSSEEECDPGSDQDSSENLGTSGSDNETWSSESDSSDDLLHSEAEDEEPQLFDDVYEDFKQVSCEVVREELTCPVVKMNLPTCLFPGHWHES